MQRSRFAKFSDPKTRRTAIHASWSVKESSVQPTSYSARACDPSRVQLLPVSFAKKELKMMLWISENIELVLHTGTKYHAKRKFTPCLSNLPKNPAASSPGGRSRASESQYHKELHAMLFTTRVEFTRTFVRKRGLERMNVLKPWSRMSGSV